MKQRSAPKVAEARLPAGAPAAARPIEPTRSRLAVCLPERDPVLPATGQDSPAWQVSYQFLGIFDAIAPGLAELGEVGIVAFEVELADPDAPPGVIPEFEDGPIGGLLRERLPAIIRQGSAELRKIIDAPIGRRGRMTVAAKFLVYHDDHDKFESIVNFVNNLDSFPPLLAEPVTEEPTHSSPDPANDQADADPRSQLIDALLATLPVGGEERLDSLASLIDTFRLATARPLQDALNSYLGEIAQNQKGSGPIASRSEDRLSLEEKQHIVDIINNNLDRLGLAITYKQSACYLACTGGTSKGRFLLVPRGSKTPLLARVGLSDFLPLELVDASPVRTAPKTWLEREDERRAENSDKGII